MTPRISTLVEHHPILNLITLEGFHCIAVSIITDQRMYIIWKHCGITFCMTVSFHIVHV